MGRFEEKLKETKLPKMAKLLLPNALTKKTQEVLADHPDMESVLKKAISAVEHGSPEKLEKLVIRYMKEFGNNRTDSGAGRQ